jgi:hypothetical protein
MQKKHDHKKFQSLSQCEAHAMAREVAHNLEEAYARGIMEAHTEINKRLADDGIDIEFTYEIQGG